MQLACICSGCAPQWTEAIGSGWRWCEAANMSVKLRWLLTLTLATLSAATLFKDIICIGPLAEVRDSISNRDPAKATFTDESHKGALWHLDTVPTGATPRASLISVPITIQFHFIILPFTPLSPSRPLCWPPFGQNDRIIRWHCVDCHCS